MYVIIVVLFFIVGLFVCSFLSCFGELGGRGLWLELFV